MPNPNFVPLIGSSFDNLAQQQQSWAGFNRGVDESNLDRAAQAQRTRNAWLAQVAKMQQDEADRQQAAQLQSQSLARQEGRQQYEDTESKRRFDIGTQLTQGQQALEKQHWDFNQSERNKAERKALDLAENFGKAKAPEANDLGKKLDDASAEYEQAKADLNRSISTIQGKYPGVHWDNRQKMFVSDPMSKTKATPETLQEANVEFSNAKADADKAATMYATAHESFNQLVKEAEGYGLTVQKKGNRRVLFSPAHNTFFGDTTSSSQGQPFESEFGAGTSDAASAMRNPAPYPGFTQGTGTVAPPGSGALRIGRFSVIPQ